MGTPRQRPRMIKDVEEGTGRRVPSKGVRMATATNAGDVRSVIAGSAERVPL